LKKKVNYKTKLAYYEIAEFIKKYITTNTIIICIGTDKCIGDCLGPLVGTFLEESSFPIPVYGTLESPIHALNIDKKIEEIKKLHPNSTIVGIDACLGDANCIGEIHVRDYPIHPGKGVGKSLPEVGIASIIGIVDSSDNAEFFTSRAIRLSLVFQIAKVISHGLNYAYHLNSDNK
jgi:putative sporulation protein YyaC